MEINLSLFMFAVWLAWIVYIVARSYWNLRKKKVVERGSREVQSES